MALNSSKWTIYTLNNSRESSDYSQSSLGGTDLRYIFVLAQIIYVWNYYISSVERTQTKDKSSTNKMVITVVLATVFLTGISYSYPLHASCKLDWTFCVSCSTVQQKLINQINAWHTNANCPGGAGEKCLYTLTSYTSSELKLTHETPVHHYVDDITFTFARGGTADKCNVHGYSTSETWYAILDYSTNYCNMRNLAEGADLHKDSCFSETTSNSVCTQYSSRNCEKY